MNRATTPNILDAVLAIGPAVAAVPPGQPLQRRCAELRPHPLNETIYGDRADGDLIESIRQRGVLNPILITGDNLIVSGHRRWGAAIAAGLETVPVVVYTGDDSLDIEEALIESNRQRSKTNEQIGREYKRLKEIYNERASRQGQRSDLTSLSIESEVAGKPSEQAAAELGVSYATAYRIEKVVDRIDELQAAGQPEEAAGLRDTLNRSVNAAHQQVRPVRRTLDTWIMQSIVATVQEKLYADLDLKIEAGLRMTARYLREDARNRSGLLWRECAERADQQGEWTHNTLVQAINNLANILEERAKAIAELSPVTPQPLSSVADLHTGAGRTPPPPLTVAEIVEELTPHLAGFAPGNIAGAALGQQNDVTERCALVLSDFTYQQTDLRRALQRIANDRHLAMSKEGSAPVVNGDHPLPGWAQEEPVLPQAQEPEQVAEPVEALPVSQRSDYESDEWYTPAEYIEAARAVMGGIELDPASSEMAQTIVRADAYLTKWDDGLRQTRWIHQRIWLNPPYSNPGPWIEKLVREHQAGPFCTEAIVLVNNATETSWFQMLLERFPVCLPARRIAFWRHDHANVGARQGQAFFYLGPNVARFQEVFSQFGPILRRMA